MSEKLTAILHVFGTERDWSRPYIDIYALLNYEVVPIRRRLVAQQVFQGRNSKIKGTFLEIRFPNQGFGNFTIVSAPIQNLTEFRTPPRMYKVSENLILSYL